MLVSRAVGKLIDMVDRIGKNGLFCTAILVVLFSAYRKEGTG
jgi:hypothetical protein